ncbi:MAG: hypothetical protein IID36_10110 [Planctomycetes bacterium]|nr:hypothetical protein [Planctomycetota bacterium]
MGRTGLTRYVVGAGGLVLVVASGAFSQTTLDAPVGEIVAYEVDSGPRDNAANVPSVVFHVGVTIPDAVWIRLYFADVHLPAGSFLRVTSAFDGAVQHLDAARLAEWSNTSAYFNGSTVFVDLVAGPGTTGNRLGIQHVTAQIGDGGVAGEFCGTCDGDDRVSSDVAYAGRVMPVGCTATMYNERGCFVCAGHCMGAAIIIEFNVPQSNPDGTLQHPDPEHQYAVIQGSIDFVNGGVGNDWSHFICAPNSETGLKAIEAQGEFIPISSSLPTEYPVDLEIFGYGVDTEPQNSQTQQLSTGPLLGTQSGGNPSWFHLADTTGGNSGSSILYKGEIIGIVTHCTFGCPNFGTIVNIFPFVQARRLCELSYDFDDDGDVDMIDFMGWQNCYPWSPLPPGCEVFDLNDNERVDLDDLPPFLTFLEGPQG